MFYSTGVTNELVRTLGLSDKTPPGLSGLKPSSNSVLPVDGLQGPPRTSDNPVLGISTHALHEILVYNGH